MQYTLKQLQNLISVSEHGSISAAASHLFISQPALSTSIAQLEKSLGLSLLIRHHARGVSLTPAGADFLARARSLLTHAQEIEEDVRELRDSISGDLAVGCFVTLAPFFVPRLMSDLNESHPQLQIRFIEGTLDRLQQLLKSGDIEVALLYALELDSELHSEDLTVIKPHVLLPPDHPLAEGKSVSLKALQGESMILLDLPHSREYFQQLFQHLGIDPRIEQRSASFELVRGLVARGHGYSVLNLQPASELTYDGARVRFGWCWSDYRKPGRPGVLKLLHRPVEIFSPVYKHENSVLFLCRCYRFQHFANGQFATHLGTVTGGEMVQRCRLTGKKQTISDSFTKYSTLMELARSST